jgi:hypothetical protein
MRPSVTPIAHPAGRDGFTHRDGCDGDAGPRARDENA